MQDTDRTARAYKAGATIARSRIASDAPEDAQALEDVTASDIVVVGGVYDHVELVLGALEMPHTRVSTDRFAEVDLRPDQLLIVNCPGHLPARSIPRVADFVARGGSLFTTDWALKHVIEPAFPHTISYNRRPTRDDVVRVEIADHDNPFLKGVLDGNDDPQWWLEASSYPITIHDHDRVKVLLSSSELGARYGETPVAVLFGHGGGEVFHMISHYYLQRTELRSERHSMPASAWASEKSVPVSPGTAAEMADLKLGEVESAGTSARLFANVVAQHKKRTSR
jgi:hypothetical protein